MLIQKYTPDWPKRFLDIKCEIDSCLDGLEYRIEHVGSTSVPGLDGKDIIDMDVIYDNSSSFEEIKSRLIHIGYYHNGDQGVLQREVFKRKEDQSNRILDTIKHHLYVCPVNSEPLKSHIFFRDFLRKHGWARTQYQSLKHDLAEQAGHDKKIYAHLKEMQVSDFIESIIEKEKNH